MSDIADGLEVLSLFTGERRLLSNGDVAGLTGLPRSTTSRLLWELAAAGFLSETRERRYRLAASPGPCFIRKVQDQWGNTA